MESSKAVTKTINISVARNTRVPCLWERGGYDEKKKKGYVILICDKYGEKKNSITQREEINNRHALIPIQKGDLCIEAIKDDKNKVFEGKICINIWRIDNINIHTGQLLPTGDALLCLVNNLSFDIWIDEEQSNMLSKVIEAAKEKCVKVNCKACSFVIPRNKVFNNNKKS